MKKKFALLFTLFILYMVLNLIFNFSKKYSADYNIFSDDEKFVISEQYNIAVKKNYFLTITHNDIVYSYQFGNKYFGKKIVKDIKYYKDDNMECILPIFKNSELIFDITCQDYNSDFQVYYHNISKKDNKIEQLYDGYDNSKFLDNNDNYNTINLFDIYVDNIGKNKFSVETYKGIININKSVKEVNIFKKDIYNKEIHAYTDNYYIVANYNDVYEFNKFFVVNLSNNSVNELSFNFKISFDSYIQGIDGDYIYLLDTENKKQYKIDCKSMSITEIGSLNKGVRVYKNGVWSDTSFNNVLENNEGFDFKNNTTYVNDNIIIDKQNNYLYKYVKYNDRYNVYKSNLITPNIRLYLFYTNNYNKIIYKDGNVYFQNDDIIWLYNEFSGLKKIIQSNELLFNENILFHAN